MNDARKTIYRALGLIMDELRDSMDCGPPHVRTWVKVRRDLARVKTILRQKISAPAKAA